MNPKIISYLTNLSDHELLARIKQIAEREREATATLIGHLAEIDRRRLYLGEGYSSLFAYCTQELHLSEHAAYGRIEAARLLERFPIILDMLSDGSVNLTTVGLLAPHLTEENYLEVLGAARHKSKRQVEELVVRLHPRPDVASTIRKLPTMVGAAAMTLSVLSEAADNQPIDKSQGIASSSDVPTPHLPGRILLCWFHWPPNDIRCNSRQAPKLSRSYGSRKIYCAIRSLTVIPRRSSILRWQRYSRISPKRNTLQLIGHATAASL